MAAEAAVSIAVETIINLLKEEANFLIGVKDQAGQLQAELQRMQWLLKDADSRQNEADVGVFISQTRDLAYQAEDLIERYAFEAEHRSWRGFANIIKRCVCILDECLTLHQMGSGIESLRSKIADLTRSFNELGIREVIEREDNSSSRQQQLLRRTYSTLIEEDLVGGESQVEVLVENLKSESYKMVGIYGMGGLGKTTLATKVYHHPHIRRHFQLFVWVCVSQQWQTRDLLETVLNKFISDPERIKKLRDEDLVRQILEFQQSHKCLVVLDDIWSINAWDSIKSAFYLNLGGSKLLLTTRNRDVAIHVDLNGFLYEPKLLSEEESWELLHRVTFTQRHTTDSNEIHSMKVMGKKMSQHCGGLPLAVIVLGGILAHKNSLVEWERVYRNIKAYMMAKENNDQDGKLKSVLSLSYNDLPYRLKPCFLYLSHYPEDADIDVEPLCQIWIAEGMVSVEDKIGDETMMDVAERYLRELAERCLVSVKRNEEGSSMLMLKSCRMHDMMRELCLLKAKEENFIQVIHWDPVNGSKLLDSFVFSRTNPRVAIYLQSERKVYDISFRNVEKEMVKHLRSLIVSFSIECLVKEFPFDKFKKLRVLVIKGEFESIPSSIGKLIHLRNLTVKIKLPSSRGDIRRIKIPSSIGNLKYLQTLNFGSSIDKIILPGNLRKLKQLKHLCLPSYGALGESMQGLLNLEILQRFNASVCDVKMLATLRNLRSLQVDFVTKLKDLEELLSIVEVNLINLKYLWLDVSSCDFSVENGQTFLVKVFSCTHLNDLLIRQGKVIKLPEYQSYFLENLYRLELENVKIEEDPMKTLEKLPRLTTLRLYYGSFVGEEMICNGSGFPHLKSLTLSGLVNLKSWRIEQGAMPSLSTLRICDCAELKMIPDGMRFVKTLKVFEIMDMPFEFGSRIQVKDGVEGEDFDKIRHVPSIIISHYQVHYHVHSGSYYVMHAT